MMSPSGARTGAMIAGTLLAAAGLNIGVLSLSDPDPAPATVDVAAAPVVIEETSAVIPLSDTSGGVTDAEPQSPPFPAPASGDDGSAIDNAGTNPTTSAPTTSYPAADVELIDHEIPGVARVTIAFQPGRWIDVLSVTTESGWVSRIDDEHADEVKVEFWRQSDSREAELAIKFEDGELKFEEEH